MAKIEIKRDVERYRQLPRPEGWGLRLYRVDSSRLGG